MSYTYAEVRLARKRAYDRVRYELEKQNPGAYINVGGAGYELIPINKKMTQAELDYYYEYFNQLRREKVSDYVELKYEVKDVSKPVTVRNPYGRRYRLEEVDKYVETGYTPEHYYDDPELQSEIWKIDVEREEQYRQSEPTDYTPSEETTETPYHDSTDDSKLQDEVWYDDYKRDEEKAIEDEPWFDDWYYEEHKNDKPEPEVEEPSFPESNDYVEYDEEEYEWYDEDDEPLDSLWADSDEIEEESEEPEPETYEDEPEPPFWEYDDYYDEFEGDYEDGVAPNSFSSIDEMIGHAYDYGSMIGEAFEEAIGNIMNVTGLDGDSIAGLTNNMTDVWDELEKASSYINVEGSARDKTYAIGLNHLNTALSKLYAGFGLTYVRGI